LVEVKAAFFLEILDLSLVCMGCVLVTGIGGVGDGCKGGASCEVLEVGEGPVNVKVVGADSKGIEVCK
jgi:hypothetical protein